MVNAVLRKLAAAPPAELPEDSAANLALASAHPAWLVERWVRFFGLDTAKAICRHGQQQPVPQLRLADRSAEEELAQQGIALAPGSLLSAARTVTSGDVTATTAFREGRIRMQDEGSQLVAEIAGRGNAILDCCAAPGGKTLILAEHNPQARIVACEASPQRLETMRERFAPHAQQIECRLADVTTLTENARYDLALADVPCSGTGTLGRNPEIRHRLKPDDLPRQAERQRAILRRRCEWSVPADASFTQPARLSRKKMKRSWPLCSRQHRRSGLCRCTPASMPCSRKACSRQRARSTCIKASRPKAFCA